MWPEKTARSCSDQVLRDICPFSCIPKENNQTDKDNVEPPPFRSAALERLMKAKVRLKRTLAGCKKRRSRRRNVPFPSTVKPYLQTLLELLTGDAAENFQKLQDRSLSYNLLSINGRDEIRHQKFRNAAAFERVMKHPETSPHIEEAVKLLLKVKVKLFCRSKGGMGSTLLLGNLLQVISEELQKENISIKKQKDSQFSGWRLDEDARLDLASLLQKTVQFLEARENKSREEVVEVDELDSNPWEHWYWHPYPSSKIIDRRVEAKRMGEAEETLKRTLQRCRKLKSRAPDGLFPSTIKRHLQALLEVLTGDAMEDFQTLQDNSHFFYMFSMDRRDERRHRKKRVATAFEEALKYPETSPHVKEAVKLLLEVKNKLFCSSDWETRSTLLLGNLLQVISEELQTAGEKMKIKDSTQSGRRLDEDACLDLASLLHKTVEFLEARENKSREEVMQVDEEDWKRWMHWYWDPFPSSRIFRGLSKETRIEIHQYFVVVFAERHWSRPQFCVITAHTKTVASASGGGGVRIMKKIDIEVHRYFALVFSGGHFLWSCFSSFFLTVDLGMTSMNPRLLVLLLLASLLTGLAASPLPARPRVQGGGRAEQGQAYSLTCVVKGPPGTDTISSYDWYKDGDIIRDETQQVLTFTRLTPGDAGNYTCGLRLAGKAQSLQSEPFQLIVLVLENVTMVPEVEVEEGETVILNCSVHSVPTARLLWIMDGKILRRVESNSDSLVLHNASRFHMKVFHCQASNREFFKILGADTQIRIKGTYEIIPKPHLRRYGLPVLHQSFKLACVLLQLPEKTAHIRLTYTWFKDHREIPGQSGQVLQFDSLTKEDGGVYTCIARNGKPETTSPESNEVDLLVLLPPRVHMEPASPHDVIRRAAGEELTLTCKVTEAIPWVPAHAYSWSYLPSNKEQRRSLVGRESTLRLGRLTREDSGQYSCQAKNDQDFPGKIPPRNASVTVDVVYLGNITLTPDLKANEGDYVTLTCSVDSNPVAELTWIVEEQEVRHVTHNVDHYVLERAACSDNKTYTCRASNTGLERHASTNIRVICNRTVGEQSSPSPSPSTSTQVNRQTGPAPFQQSWHWVLAAVLASALIIALLVALYLYKRSGKQSERRTNDPATQSCLSERDAETSSSSVSRHLVAPAEA